jgi:hypothetical protein
LDAIVLGLDIAQESKELTAAKLLLHANLKKRSLGLAAIERARLKQASRLSSIKLGDANTQKKFHHRANAR